MIFVNPFAMEEKVLFRVLGEPRMFLPENFSKIIGELQAVGGGGGASRFAGTANGYLFFRARPSAVAAWLGFPVAPYNWSCDVPPHLRRLGVVGIASPLLGDFP
ncbi:MAG: hypothetical protein ACYCOU_00650 [Sulfobacillus sp.]